MKIAVIGQSQFGEEVYKLIRSNGHEVVGVFTIPDVNGKPDQLGNYISKTFCFISLGVIQSDLHEVATQWTVGLIVW